jgi:hypothetical protein
MQPDATDADAKAAAARTSAGTPAGRLAMPTTPHADAASQAHRIDRAMEASRIDRCLTLGATSVAVFTFALFFLHPQVVHGKANAFLFHTAIVTMGVATLSFVFAALHYYGASLAVRVHDAKRARYGRMGDRAWLLGYSLLFLAPSLLFFAVHLGMVGTVWLTLWFVYFLFVLSFYANVQPDRPRRHEAEGWPD